MRQGKESLSRPFLDQMGRRHHQAGERPSRAMHQHAAQRDERLACTTLRHHVRVARQLPAPAHTHDGHGLCRIWRAQHLR